MGLCPLLESIRRFEEKESKKSNRVDAVEYVDISTNDSSLIYSCVCVLLLSIYVLKLRINVITISRMAARFNFSVFSDGHPIYILTAPHFTYPEEMEARA